MRRDEHPTDDEHGRRPTAPARLFGAFLATVLLGGCWPTIVSGADGDATTSGTAAVNPWAASGGPPPSTAATPAAVGADTIARSYALPTTVIHGGAIPPGWQPRPIAYQGIGPDGKPVTMNVAPTYVFTFVSGPPVLVGTPLPPASQVNRVQAAPGWSYQGQGAPVTATALPVVARYAPVPYQYPPGSPALAGQTLVPPATPASPAPMLAQGSPAPPVAALAPPPTQWVSAPVPPPTIGGPADGAGQALAAAAPAAMAGAAAAVAATDAPTASIAPAAAAPPPVDQSRMVPVAPAPADPSPPQAAPASTSTSPVSQSRATTTHLWRVVGVHDGDTVTCLDETNTQQKVRLAEIDAPELGQDYGKVARESLAEMVFGKTVTVQDEGRDRYGRWIAHVQVNGVDVNRQMVATGNAWHYADYSRDAALGALQSQAQERRLGLWAQADPVPPWEFRAAGRKTPAG